MENSKSSHPNLSDSMIRNFNVLEDENESLSLRTDSLIDFSQLRTSPTTRIELVFREIMVSLVFSKNFK